MIALDSSLLALPWQIQFSLAAGYAGYALAYTGIRSHHQTIDVAFRTLVFSAIATAVLYQSDTLEPHWAGTIALLVTLTAGVVWRTVGRPFLRLALSELRVAHADDDPTVVTRLSDDSRHEVTQVSVTLVDGTQLHCDSTAEFRDAPISPLILGRDGSIGFYVTRSRSPSEQEDVEHKITRVLGWGDRMTVIPSSQVRQMELRYRKRS